MLPSALIWDRPAWSPPAPQGHVGLRGKPRWLRAAHDCGGSHGADAFFFCSSQHSFFLETTHGWCDAPKPSWPRPLGLYMHSTEVVPKSRARDDARGTGRWGAAVMARCMAVPRGTQPRRPRWAPYISIQKLQRRDSCLSGGPKMSPSLRGSAEARSPRQSPASGVCTRYAPRQLLGKGTVLRLEISITRCPPSGTRIPLLRFPGVPNPPAQAQRAAQAAGKLFSLFPLLFLLLSFLLFSFTLFFFFFYLNLIETGWWQRREGYVGGGVWKIKAARANYTSLFPKISHASLLLKRQQNCGGGDEAIKGRAWWKTKLVNSHGAEKKAWCVGGFFFPLLLFPLTGEGFFNSGSASSRPERAAPGRLSCMPRGRGDLDPAVSVPTWPNGVFGLISPVLHATKRPS